MKKKYIVWGCVCVLLLIILALCFVHKHKAKDDWQADLEMHWQLCDKCNRKYNYEKHVLDDDNFCKKCQQTIIDNGNGDYRILTYDEQGSIKRQTDYDADDNVMFEMICETKYFKDENPKQIKKYHDGILVQEIVYLPCEKDEYKVYVSEERLYGENGSKRICQYNDDNLLISYTSYDAAGSIEFAETYEYVFDDSGNLIKQLTKINSIPSIEKTYMQDDEGNSYLAQEVLFDENGKVVSEVKYDAKGNVIK